MKKIIKSTVALLSLLIAFTSCNNSQNSNGKSGALSSSAAEKVYVAPGEHDEFYAFISGGFSGQLSVYGLPSGRLFKVIPVFSQDAEKAYGYSEETKPMLNTSYGFIPWDDAHHPDISQTNGILDGRYVFINANNTPRIAKIDLTTFGASFDPAKLFLSSSEAPATADCILEIIKNKSWQRFTRRLVGL